MFVACYFSLTTFKILFVFDSQHFNHNMPQGQLLCINVMWGLLSFINWDIHIFSKILAIFSHYFFKFSAPFSLSLLTARTPIMYILVCLWCIVSPLSYVHSHLFFFMPLLLDHFQWPVFEITDPFFSLI